MAESSPPINPRKLKVPELRAELTRRGVATAGLRKAALVAALEAALDEEAMGFGLAAGEADDGAGKALNAAPVAAPPASDSQPVVPSASEPAAPGPTEAANVSRKQDGAPQTAEEGAAEPQARTTSVPAQGNTVPLMVTSALLPPTAPPAAQAAVAPAAVTAAPDEEAARRAARAKRFNFEYKPTPSATNGKKKVGTTSAGKPASGAQLSAKLKQRAARFGTSAAPTLSAEEQARRAKRAARFGLVRQRVTIACCGVASAPGCAMCGVFVLGGVSLAHAHENVRTHTYRSTRRPPPRPLRRARVLWTVKSVSVRNGLALRAHPRRQHR